MATRSTDKPVTRRPPVLGPPPLPAPGGPGPCLDPRLAAELAGPAWDQSWELTPAIHTPAADPAARQRWWTLAEMLRPHARDALLMASEPRALDLRCGEGWIAQRLLDWGADRVVGVDQRPERLRRARLLRDHFSIPASELELPDPGEWIAPEVEEPTARFTVVVLAGAVEQLLDGESLATARQATGSVCAIECRGAEANAVAATALAAGFTSVDRVRPPLQGAPLYVHEEHDLLVARLAIGG